MITAVEHKKVSAPPTKAKREMPKGILRHQGESNVPGIHSAVAKTDGLKNIDTAHLHSVGQGELGKRYAAKMLAVNSSRN